MSPANAFPDPQSSAPPPGGGARSGEPGGGGAREGSGDGSGGGAGGGAGSDRGSGGGHGAPQRASDVVGDDARRGEGAPPAQEPAQSKDPRKAADPAAKAQDKAREMQDSGSRVKRVAGAAAEDAASAASSKAGDELKDLKNAKGAGKKVDAGIAAAGSAAGTALGGEPGRKIGNFIGKQAARYKKFAIALPLIAPLSIVAILLVMVIIVGTTFAAVFQSGGGLNEHPSLEKMTGRSAIEEFKKAGTAYEVPWTVIAAISAAATETGKYSPYDQIDRAPGREGIRGTSAVATPVASTVRGGEALGPCQVRPVPGEISSGFGYRGGSATVAGFHGGVDMNAQLGEPIGACLGGTVRWASFAGACGNGAGIDHGEGLATEYCHMSELKISAGDTVTAGQIIGLVGSTGQSTGPHLHLEVVVNGTNVDPLSIQPPAGVASASGAAVTVIGDSLCEAGGAQDVLRTKLESAGWRPTFDCVRGRSLGDGQTAKAAIGSSPGALVVALGTNDAVGGNGEQFTTGIDTVMAESGGIPVVWVNVATSQAGATAINAAIAAASSRYANLTVADANGTVPVDQRAGDGIHLTGDGYATRADLIATTLSKSLSNAPGGLTVAMQNPAGLEVSAFPTVEPAIGGGPGQPGVGPFLIRKLAADQAGINPQSLISNGTSEVKTATDYIASELSKARYAMERDGWDAQASQEQFWAEAVRRLPLVDPRDGECPSGDAPVGGSPAEVQKLVGGEIQRMWECELSRAESLTTLVGIALSDGKYTNTLTGTQQTTTLVREALTAAWAWSQWGSQACDDNAELAGVFPLTREVFDKYAPGNVKSRGRCNAPANIQAAARAFVAGEAPAPGQKPGGLELPVTDAMISPIAGASTLTDTYDAPAVGPVCGCRQDVSITATPGTSVLAMEAGKVTIESDETSIVVVLQGATAVYRYDDLGGLADRLTSGQQVTKGQLIGTTSGEPLRMSATVAGSPVRLHPTLKQLRGEEVPPPVTDASGTIGDRTASLGKYAPMIGGWWAMPWVLGDEAARARFLNGGPGAIWTPDAACLDAVDALVLAGGGVLPDCGVEPAQVEALVVRRANQLKYQAASRAAPAQREDPMAVDPDTGAAPEAPTPSDAGTADPTTRAFTLPDTLTAAQIEEYTRKADAAITAVGSAGEEIRPGRDVIIPRLNQTAAALSVPAVPVSVLKDEYASIVTLVAIDMGGLREADRRYEDVDNPLARLAAFKRGGGSAATSGKGLVGGEIPYADVFNAAGQEFDLDPRMIAAVAFVESGFREDNIFCRNRSSAGALGIMQFMPATAAGFGIDPCDPLQAIPAGARLLRGQFERFGTWELAWAAYNAGAGNVMKYGGVPPFAETQAYVVKVPAKWAEYKEKFPDARLTTTTGPGCLRTVQGINVACAVAPNLEAMLAKASTEGLVLTGGGYRSQDQQIALRRAHCGSSDYDIYQKPAGECSPPTAIPGTSNHEKGEAVDFDNCSTRATACYAWLSRNAGAFGFKNLESEPWHWSTDGR